MKLDDDTIPSIAEEPVLAVFYGIYKKRVSFLRWYPVWKNVKQFTQISNFLG